MLSFVKQDKTCPKKICSINEINYRKKESPEVVSFILGLKRNLRSPYFYFGFKSLNNCIDL